MKLLGVGRACHEYAQERIMNMLKSELKERLGPRGIVVEDVLLKDVVLPQNLSTLEASSYVSELEAEKDSERDGIITIVINEAWCGEYFKEFLHVTQQPAIVIFRSLREGVLRSQEGE